ncbi:unnamed protein product [Protopolystoma xenopodis]|uniref:Uncharacterized protein n=1 Tax=Protopolystoma xenopodis TaxID=117903 RepID=A0A448WNV4_9PLAT|nr:unnamed protein product [Protopolystoma xenopodis]
MRLRDSDTCCATCHTQEGTVAFTTPQWQKPLRRHPHSHHYQRHTNSSQHRPHHRYLQQQQQLVNAFLLMFGTRPWLGIEHRLPPKRPRFAFTEKAIKILN